MSDGGRTAAHPVDLFESLERQPYRFGFFQALRRLECLDPTKPRWGESKTVQDDAVRLGQEPSLAFAPAALSKYRKDGDGRAARLGVWFFGLFGPHGALPLHLTDYARRRLENQGDATLVRFLDIFHHRMLSLFYRAWSAAQPTTQFDRARLSEPNTDRFARYVASLLGLGMKSLRRRDAMPDLAKLHYAGWLACQTRSAEGLRAILSDFLRLPIRIEQFVGHWLELPNDCRCRLAQSRASCELGNNLTLGARVWECQSTFRIAVGPLAFGDFQELLPGRDWLRRLVAVVRNYVGDALRWELNLVLRKEEVPPLVLGRQCQLGWTTWLTGTQRETDAHEVMIQPCP